MRLLGAIRLSKEKDESTSPQRQEADIRGEAKSLGATLVGLPTDLDVSADKFSPFQRPELGPWLRERTDEFDALAFSRADRAIRTMRDMHTLSEWAIQHRKMIIFIVGPGGGPRMVLDFRHGPLDTMTQFMVTVFAFAAEMELNVIKDRTRGSQALARDEGRWHGGTPPYGYEVVKHPSGKGYVLAVDPESSERVKEIVAAILAGKSMNAVCMDFNARGIPTPSDHYRSQVGKPMMGHRWKTTAINPILRSKTILGIAEKDGKPILDSEDMPVMRAKAIVSREDWNAVQARLDKNSVTKTRSATHSFLLNLLFCSECGMPSYRLLTGSVKAKHRHVYYRCRGRAEKLNGCLANSVRADKLEALVEEIFLAAAGEFEVMRRVVLPAESHAEELRQAQETWEHLQDEMDGKSAVIRQGYQSRIARLEERIERLSAMPERPARVELRGTGQSFRQAWAESDTAARREILKESGLTVFTTPLQGSSQEAVKAHWEKLSMTEGNRHMVTLEPSDTGNFYASLIWHGDLATRIREKMNA
ncbi:recombinase family protein [Micromonospora chokoriensis]